jgi:hypothetical protein
MLTMLVPRLMVSVAPASMATRAIGSRPTVSGTQSVV